MARGSALLAERIWTPCDCSEAGETYQTAVTGRVRALGGTRTHGAGA
jgi:hypothetical protein